MMLFLIIMEFGELTLSVLPQLGRWRYISYLKEKKHPEHEGFDQPSSPTVPRSRRIVPRTATLTNNIT